MPAKDPPSADEDGGHATRVVLSYPSSLSRRTRSRIKQPYYRTYLRKILDDVAEGDRHDDFTDVGCCGSQLHVEFRIESVDGPQRVGRDTTLEFTERSADSDEIPDNPWAVQNEIG